MPKLTKRAIRHGRKDGPTLICNYRTASILSIPLLYVHTQILINYASKQSNNSAHIIEYHNFISNYRNHFWNSLFWI